MARVIRLVLAAILGSRSQTVCSEVAGAVPQCTVFTHVNVVPMDADRILRDQSILVEHGIVAAIGIKIAAPEGCTVVEAEGRWLSPGLADMHTHATTPEDLKVYLANGVTSVLNMGDATTAFIDNTRVAANRGEIPAPRVFAGLRVDGTPEYGALVVQTSEQAVEVARMAKINGYDFIKVYNNLAPSTFYAFVRAGRSIGLPVIGHGVARVGLVKQIEAGQVLIAHTEEFFYTVFGGQEPPTGPAPDWMLVAPVLSLLRAHGTYVTADLNTFATIAAQWGKPAAISEMLRQPSVQYVGLQDRVAWLQSDYVGRQGSIERRLAFLGRFTKALADAGIPLVVGTDAPAIPGLAPGFSLHDDMRRLEDVGLSRFQVLSMATRIPGEFLRRYVPTAGRSGTISVGNRADLVLSRANPLDDLDTLRHPLGVMVGGHWHDAKDLADLLGSVAREYDAVTARGGTPKS